MTMQWNIDKALRVLEPESCPGTQITRVFASLNDLARFGCDPKKADEKRLDNQLLWCLSIGRAWEAKAFFYGFTIREAYLKALKAAKKGELAKYTPWGIQSFQPKLKAKKKIDTKKRKDTPKKRQIDV
jgi:hypothetical protein